MIGRFLDQFPGLEQLLVIFAALTLIALIVRYIRGAVSVGRGFVIRVDRDDITFLGQFPSKMQGMVTEFLRHDVGIEEPYEIRGHWEGTMLVIIVRGEAARPMEQRIRNFLKLNIKPPR